MSVLMIVTIRQSLRGLSGPAQVQLVEHTAVASPKDVFSTGRNGRSEPGVLSGRGAEVC